MFGCLSSRKRGSSLLIVASLLAGCASGGPTAPYPVFVNAEELPDMFLAGLPGVRAKRISGSDDSRQSGNVLSLPPNWDFTTGGFPQLSVELFVLTGSVTLGEFELRPGGYAYLPDGTSGVRLQSVQGATLLYFLDDANPRAAIRTPLITNQDLLLWSSDPDYPDTLGVFMKELRNDPGSGARTWLRRVDGFANAEWVSRSTHEQGYLVEGSYRHAECVDGQEVVGEYGPGGFFVRPAGAVNGGPNSGTEETAAIWLLRVASADAQTTAACVPSEPP